MKSLDLELRLRAVEARLTELEDDRSIRELLAGYGSYADEGRSEAYVGLFTKDGVLEYPVHQAKLQGASNVAFGPGTARPEEEELQRRVGHAEIRTLIADPYGHKLIEGMSLHFMGNNLVTKISDISAQAESYNFTVVRRGADFILITAGVNEWKLEKADGKWLIKECKRRYPGSKGFIAMLSTLNDALARP